MTKTIKAKQAKPRSKPMRQCQQCGRNLPKMAYRATCATCIKETR